MHRAMRWERTNFNKEIEIYLCIAKVFGNLGFS